MLQVILTVGIPSSGKSTWAKQHVAKDPTNWVRINNDMLRSMCNNTVYTADYEKLIVSTRVHMIKQALLMNKNVIVDNVNLGKRNFQEAINAALSSNVDVKIYEKPFYIPLDEALQRDSSRVGKEKVGEDIIRKFWKSSGGAQHKYYVPREEVYLKKISYIEKMEQDKNLPSCAIIDLDGSMCDIKHRNPYDASTCDKDSPIEHVVDMSKLLYSNNNKIIFFSGRENKYRSLTEKWLKVHFGEDFSLYMREDNNQENDALLKERLFNTHIKNKFYCKAWIDDRLRVCQKIFEMGLPLFRVGDPNASF